MFVRALEPCRHGCRGCIPVDLCILELQSLAEDSVNQPYSRDFYKFRQKNKPNLQPQFRTLFVSGCAHTANLPRSNLR